MILAISRFRVANGMEDAVREAFFNRPHYVDSAPGYLGMETFTDSKDGTIFYLVTRWTDANSFQTWHRSKDHRLSHQFIPKGLKLDPGYTQILLLERLSTPKLELPLTEYTADHEALAAGFFSHSNIVHYLVADPEGVILACNEAIASNLNVPAAEMIGQRLWDYLTADGVVLLKEKLQGGARKPEDNFLMNFVDVTKAPFTLRCHLDVQPNGFAMIGEPLTKRDEALKDELLRLNNDLAVLNREHIRRGRMLEKTLAELKHAQAALVHQEKIAALGQMTAGLAHEINNPVAYVLGNHHTLGRDFKDVQGFLQVVNDSLPALTEAAPELGTQLAECAREADLDYLFEAVPRKLAANVEGLERVRQIILDLRMFSRLDEDGFKECDVTASILSTVRLLSSLEIERGVTIETDLAMLPPVMCSPGTLNQALSNVIANAMQASAPGQVVKVSTREEDSSWVIRVEDEGCGIASEHLTKLFDPFFTTKPVGEGTGLGLSIVHQIVRAHKGHIDVKSQLGKGTSISIRLPTRLPLEITGCEKD